ncbi:MAG: hypothetical protein WCI18_06555 [Pseudomonadota bacterium]
MFHKVLICFVLIGYTSLSRAASSDEDMRSWYQKLAKADFKTILKNYSFVGDFSSKAEERDSYPEVFWKYPLRLPEPQFALTTDFGNPTDYMPVLKGSSRLVEHINSGRVAYLNGDYDRARKIWLTAREEFKNKNPNSKRLSYFIGLTYLKIAKLSEKNPGGYPPDVLEKIEEGFYANAATFLSQAFIKERDFSDPEIDQMGPIIRYNIAAIYHKFSRFPSAYSTATEALNLLRDQGQNKYRYELHRIVSESLIINGNYLDAVRELDVAIRQDPTENNAREAFSRMGDVYFGLNNYETADYAYSLAIALDRGQKKISATQALLQGESLFWVGKIDQAQEMLLYGIDGAKSAKNPVDPNTLAWAKLRFADTWLAKASLTKGEERKKYLEHAKLEYFRLMNDLRGNEVAVTASLRFYCGELPAYNGNNIQHARSYLEGLKKDNVLPRQGVELAWACYANSFSERERNEEMIAKVTEFANRYPRSKFLESMTRAVKDVKSNYLGEYLKAGEKDKAIAFYQKYGNRLYGKKIPPDWASQLFTIYYDRLEFENAANFWNVADSQKVSGTADLIRRISWLEEKTAAKKNETLNKKLNVYLKEAKKIDWTKEDTTSFDKYIPRIRAVDTDFSSGTWMTEKLLAKKPNSDQVCSEVVPILSNASQKEKDKKILLKWRQFVTQLLNDPSSNIENLDESCRTVLFDLEAAMIEKNESTTVLADLWLSRLSMPLNTATAGYLWEASELLEKAQRRDDATKIWKLLSESKAPSLEESKWATLKLDGEKTQYEDLWKNK